mmetsp:Transcript_30880/g.50314  ORF Transcript_30880/g.50314 Transcript_30880/m.50314 type:complete len:405 (-) Transcript_30880:47-1261(-)
MDRSPSSFKANFGIFVILVKTTVGAGILSMPHAFMSAGYLGGPVIILLVGVVMFTSLAILQEAAQNSEHGHDYQKVVQEYLGKSAGLSAEVAITIYQGLTCCAFLIIIGDAFTPWFAMIVPHNLAWLCRPLAVVVCSTPGFYLCFYPRITQLACAMSFGVFIVTVVASVVIIDYAYHDEDSNAVAVPEEWWRSLSSISIFAFALQCHIAVPRTVSEMSADTRKQYPIIAFCAFVFIGSLYSLVGVCGYRHFGHKVHGNILGNYTGNGVAYVLQILNGCQAMFGYAINHYTARSSAYSLLVRLGALEVASDAEKQMLGQSQDIPQHPRRLITILFYLCACVVSVFLDDLGQFASLIGATVGTLVIFFYPAALSFRLANNGACLCSIILTICGCMCLVFGLLDLVT